MCRYCKKLKELNVLREKNLNDCIKHWKRRDKLARQLLAGAYCHLILFSMQTGFRGCKKLIDDIEDFINTDWIGV